MTLPDQFSDPAPATAEPAMMYDLRAVDVDLEVASGTLPILRDVSLSVRPGEIVAIVGRSGTGKTTLLRVLGGLLRPTRGEALVKGRPLTAPPAEAVTIFQDYGNALLPWRTVERNVELGLERRMPRSEVRQRAAQAIEMVGLTARRGEYPWRLSGGMQQRVQIARALAMRPQVLLMDEPFGALDAFTKASLQDQLLELQAATGSSIVLITHDMEEAVYLSDRVFVIAGAPGTITLELAVDLPRPRVQLATRELPAFLAARHRLSDELHETAP
ncbi:ABC transporter ATP-binding protein [Microbacterium fluvii]|uniref:ABC transporter ATP-binding protein n=1 Tax=Microbacterium fluvii TaxID=415215 RepID=A0ABW2H839_9MICO|nr:ABC transporter ATP-binding protein [Microbacterium fluvii]MCU4671158.1 ABC transporter ATP-binding protein [Microbacterium fluvii]